MRLYTESGGEGAELFLLHGWGMNLAVWSPVLEALEADYRVTLAELPGHGESAYDPARSRLDDWAQACLDTAPDNAVWIGWSLGGLIAQRAAMLAPERVDKLVLVSSTPRFVDGGDWPHAMKAETFHAFADSLVANPRHALERFLSLQVKGDDQARQTLRMLREDIALRPAHDDRALKDGLDLLLNTDLRDQLYRIQCPALWLLGERDTLVPANVGEDIEHLMPAAEILVLQGCAHAPFLSHAEQSLRALRYFLAEDDE